MTTCHFIEPLKWGDYTTRYAVCHLAPDGCKIVDADSPHRTRRQAERTLHLLELAQLPAADGCTFDNPRINPNV